MENLEDSESLTDFPLGDPREETALDALKGTAEKVLALLRRSAFFSAIIAGCISLFIYAIIYIAVVPGSRVIQSCSSLFSWSLFFGTTTILLLLTYFIWAVWYYWNAERLARESEVKDTLQMSLIWSNTQQDQDEFDDEDEFITTKESEQEGMKNAKGNRCSPRCCFHASCITAIFITALITVIILGVHVYMWTNTLPIVSGTRAFPQINDAKGAQIHREENGVTHIVAQNFYDLFFAQGYACAQDRLFQMDFQRRAAGGRLSEVVGEAALDTDKLFRTLNFYGAVKDSMPYHETKTLEWVQAYIDGINSYINGSPSLPIEYHILGFEPEPFVLDDIFVWLKVMSLDLSENEGAEKTRLRMLLRQGLDPARIEELYVPYPDHMPTIISDADLHVRSTAAAENKEKSKQLEFQRLRQMQREFQQKQKLQGEGVKPVRPPKEDKFLKHFMPKEFPQASNNWVVSGVHTQTGKPFLANDPHLDLTTPSIWMLVHLSTPDIDLIGASFAGMPGIVIGRSNHIAWGFTNVGADVQDLYILDEADDGQYWASGELHKYNLRTEIIKVLDAEPVEYQVRETIYGPVVNEVMDVEDDKPVALRWVALDGKDTTIDAFMDAMQAKDFSDFRAALRRYVHPSQNMIFADTEGNIGYQCPGKIPVRKPGHTGLYPVPSNGSFDWEGFIPFDELPSAFNPPEGFVASANNKLTPPSYPYSILGDYDWDVGYRSARITEMITERAAKTKLTMDDMKDIQLDQVSLLFRDFKPILDQLKGPFSPPLVGEWRDRLLLWNGNTSAESSEASVFEKWYLELTTLASEETGKEHWNRPFYLVNALKSGSTDKNCKDAEGGCLGWAKKALEKVITELAGNYSSVPSWGTFHHVSIQHRLFEDTPLECFFARYAPHGGDDYTVNVGHTGSNPTFEMKGGPSYRQLIDLSDMEKSVFVHPMGQSGNLYSDTYDNLFPLWQSGQYVEMRTKDYNQHRTMYILPERSSK